MQEKIEDNRGKVLPTERSSGLKVIAYLEVYILGTVSSKSTAEPLPS